MITMSFDWTPGIDVVSAALYDFGLDIRSVKVPLQRSVKQVMIPSIQTNFDVGGRPGWQEDTAEWMAMKQGDRILVNTGTLEGVATQVGVWKIDGQAGEASMGDFPLDYGNYNQFGWHGAGQGPARPWAVMQDEDASAIEDVFATYINERMAARGLI